VYLKDAFPDPLLKTAALASHFPAELNVSSDVLDQVVRDAIYAPYVAREVAAVARLRRDEEVALPASLEYSALPGLSAELKEKLGVVRPQSLGQAARIEGMTPAALTLILLQCREMGRMGS
jgi:tRNA uridine 5-carboxymethylaminomethyl modification enzyme